MTREELKKELIELIQTDDEFRLILIGALSSGFVTREETNKILNEIKKLREDFNKQFKAFGEKMDAFERRMDAFERRMTELREDFNRGMKAFDIKLSALGARWGIMNESAIRNALKGLLSEKLNLKVSKWEFFDRNGIVYGKPSLIDVDLAITDSEHILIEIKSHVRKSDVAELLRISELYQKSEGIKPSLMIVTPYIEEKAKEFAEANGIKVYTSDELIY
ncbi:MAG: PD-(D/E)XK nuclease family protein [Candidatus Njordarchaeia archaeon]|nr:DUF3782 domain-containing protein [Candidatus Korarchaeota archaeon]